MECSRAKWPIGMTRLMKSNVSVEDANRIVEKHTKSASSEPDVTYLKVVDTELGDKMIACAKWRINEKERTEEQIQSMISVPEEKEKDRPAARDFMNYLAWARKEFMGTKPFACEYYSHSSMDLPLTKESSIYWWSILLIRDEEQVHCL